MSTQTATRRYFTVECSHDKDLSDFGVLINEGDAEHVGTLAALNVCEIEAVLAVVRQARILASRFANEMTLIQRVFNTEIHVTWKNTEPARILAKDVQRGDFCSMYEVESATPYSTAAGEYVRVVARDAEDGHQVCWSWEANEQTPLMRRGA